MDFKCTLETRENKSGKTYDVFVIKISDVYEKLVFPEDADKEIIRLLKLNSARPVSPFNNDSNV